ncbi:MAG: nucleotidyltransferase [Nisaea sp.]|uniref:nucleotidyltransferase domain-containing protein n=1 Tax=Nisaea sp. TaxID=2024842 RepID=UPI001B1871B2|nr:nucleotidyltransferase [Nisaea sp.]MBO6560476.1 nucleotidyltransferase [Nisaea sp.]
MSHEHPFHQLTALDEVLLDVAALIELSPRDRRVAENRYRLLKEHLERDKSPLAPYLIDGVSLIYAQGSVATSTTIVSGTEDDRFDVDAIVEVDVPTNWDDSRALDELEKALQGFPGATEIVRCTRCVQIRFPFMHMDVAIMDRRERMTLSRAGEIFHSPDSGDAYRVASNPWGFTAWFRTKVGVGQKKFAESLGRHRTAAGRNRLDFINEEERLVVAKADQADLPPIIPSEIDAQEAVALKLLKRYLNLRYEDLTLNRPPSIYLTKKAGDVGFAPLGLSMQLFVLADSIAKIMRAHIQKGTRPLEVNPSYPADKINDRWPRPGPDGLTDMRTLAEQLEHLTSELVKIAIAPLVEIAKAIDDLFGERVGKEQRAVLAARHDRRKDPTPILSADRSGAIQAPAIVVSSEQYREVPRHNFHPSVLDGEDDE